MPGIISVNLDQADLLAQQTTVITVETQNTGTAPLENLNPSNHFGWPSILLTDLTSGDTSTHFVRNPPRVRRPQIDLAPGGSQRTTFDFNDLIGSVGPGTYQVTAKATWDGDQAVSEPVSLTVRPSTPSSVHLATMYGSLTPLYVAVWLNAADAKGDERDLVLTEMGIGSEAGVSRTTVLGKVPAATLPVVSVPPNKAPEAQWIAWLQQKGDKPLIRYVLYVDGDASDIEQGAIQASGATIVPPLMLHRGSPGAKLPGAVALLHVPTPERPGGTLEVVEIEPKGIKELPLQVELPGTAPRWCQSAFRSNGDRRTLWATQEGATLRLRVIRWSEKKLPDRCEDLHEWNLGFVAGGITTTQDDHIRGLLIGEVGDGLDKRYSLLPWLMAANDDFKVADPIPVQLPPGSEVIKAIPRMNANGGPCAALCVKGTPYAWCFCRYDGTIVPLSTQSSDPRLLVDVMFKQAERPVVVYVETGRGFRFVDPG